MESYQVHLASKVTAPAVPEEKGKPGIPERTFVNHGMSNRAVRYRMLNSLEIGKAYEEAATMLGESATDRSFGVLARAYLVMTMVTEFSDPTEKPLDQKTKWHKATFGEFANPASEYQWDKVFTAKDTAFLQREYSKWHEMPADVVEMLSGKAIPVGG